MSELNYADIPNSVREAFVHYETAFKIDADLENEWYHSLDTDEADRLKRAYEEFHDVEQDRGLEFHRACDVAGIDAEEVEGVILEARSKGC